MTEPDLHDEFACEIVDYVQQWSMDDSPITPDTDLLQTGLLDSLLMMDLLAHIRGAHGVEIADADLTPRNFRTPRSIASLLQTALLAPAG